MESITKPAQVLQPPENSILHPVEAYLDRRSAQEPVHLVQYDTSIPVLTVALFQKDKPYAVPAGSAVNLRLSKPDGTCVYDPVLGLSQDRRTVYVQVSRQMTAAAGLANAILEIILNGGVVGTASFLLFLEANPVTDDAILSSGEFKSLDDYVNQAETSAASAREAAEAAAESREASANSASAAKESAAGAAGSAAAAKESVAAAENSALRAAEQTEQAALSADEAAAKAREAGESAQSTQDMVRAAQSYAVGGTDTRENEDVDNARYYYDQAKRISQGLAGALLPMGTVAFANLKNQTKQAGYMYNISDAFTTDSTFREGSGYAYPAGTNVYWTAEGNWDCLAGAQVVAVNGRTGAVTITKSDVGLGNVANVAALPLTGGTLTGDLTLSGASRAIKYASGTRTNAPISFYAGDEHGSGLVIGDGGRTIIGGGESATNLHTELGTGVDKETTEEMHIASDNSIYLHTGCQTIGKRKTVTIDSAGKITAPGGFSGSLSGNATSADNVKGVVAIENGGTGAVDAATARTNLGITAANIGGSAILTEIEKVDGTGSGLDADLLDGHHESDFVKTASLKEYRINKNSGQTFNEVLATITNDIATFSFWNDPDDNPFSFPSGNGIALQSTLIYGSKARILFGIPAPKAGGTVDNTFEIKLFYLD